MWDFKQNKSICVYPYVHKHFNLENQEALCCFGKASYGNIGKNNFQIRQEIIQKIEKGNFIKGCEVCYKRENDGFISHRVEKSKQWIKRHGIPNEIKFQWFDIRNDDTCNLKCKYCGPYASSQWKKELDIPVKRKKPLDITDKEIEECKVWYQAGGEPFLNQPFYDIIVKFGQLNPNIEIVINSNLSNISGKWFDALSKLTNLTITASIDASGKLLTYLRYPVTEERITKSIQNIYKYTNATILAGPTASNLSIHAFDNTYRYFKNNLKDISQLDLGIVNEPKEYTISAIPLDERQIYIDTTEYVIKQIKNDSKSIRKMIILDRLNNILHKLTNDQYDKNLHLKLKQSITTQDQKRNLKLHEVDAFLNDWVFNKYAI